MSLNHDYFISQVAQEHQREILAQAEQDRLARLVRGRRRGWLRRWLAGRGSTTSAPLDRQPAPPAYQSAPLPEAPVDPADHRPDTDREPVGAGRVNSI